MKPRPRQRAEFVCTYHVLVRRGYGVAWPVLARLGPHRHEFVRAAVEVEWYHEPSEAHSVEVGQVSEGPPVHPV